MAPLCNRRDLLRLLIGISIVGVVVVELVSLWNSSGSSSSSSSSDSSNSDEDDSIRNTESEGSGSEREEEGGADVEETETSVRAGAATPRQTSTVDAAAQHGGPTAVDDIHRAKRRRLTINALGLLFMPVYSASNDVGEGEIMELRPTGNLASILRALSSRYDLVLIFITRSASDQSVIKAFLEDTGLAMPFASGGRTADAGPSAQRPDLLDMSISGSTVMLTTLNNENDGPKSPSSLEVSPSMLNSSILGTSAMSTPSSSVVLSPSGSPRLGLVRPLNPSQVLFCQSDESLSHIVRHLLTTDSASTTAAAHVDHNAETIAKLSPVIPQAIWIGDRDRESRSLMATLASAPNVQIYHTLDDTGLY
ncbi:hypothetical protein EV182_000377 [Spiromyces aspiralis]|uniref:Uncharacterized protein n=1 Tax=Spiromyces aspiralis TaxID=68401 RepID=A0ACC1HJN8_9FUNG|nr:hypothetical protein EV182_000377 [Spiromyces aspiralis]